MSLLQIGTPFPLLLLLFQRSLDGAKRSHGIGLTRKHDHSLFLIGRDEDVLQIPEALKLGCEILLVELEFSIVIVILLSLLLFARGHISIVIVIALIIEGPADKMNRSIDPLELFSVNANCYWYSLQTSSIESGGSQMRGRKRMKMNVGLFGLRWAFLPKVQVQDAAELAEQ